MLQKYIGNSGRFLKYDEVDAQFINSLIFISNIGHTVRFKYSRSSKKTYSLGRILLNITDPKMECDHRDRDICNFQRDNLRLATRSQNAMNQPAHIDSSSEYKGVSWHKKRKMFIVQIQKEKVRKFIGYFSNAEDAARAYDKASIEIHGEFGYLNFPSA